METTMTDGGPNLIEEIQQQAARVRELLTEYEGIGDAGRFGATMLRLTLKQADASIAALDPIAMIHSLKALRECQ